MQVDLEEPFYLFGGKTLLLKVYFDQCEADAFYSHVHTFQTWLRRNKTLPLYQREGHLHLTQFSQQLFQQKMEVKSIQSEEMTRKTLEEIQLKIKDTQHLSQRGWLEEKVKGLI